MGDLFLRPMQNGRKKRIKFIELWSSQTHACLDLRYSNEHFDNFVDACFYNKTTFFPYLHILKHFYTEVNIQNAQLMSLSTELPSLTLQHQGLHYMWYTSWSLVAEANL
jgi:hypothetical protein